MQPFFLLINWSLIIFSTNYFLTFIPIWHELWFYISILVLIPAISRNMLYAGGVQYQCVEVSVVKLDRLAHIQLPFC